MKKEIALETLNQLEGLLQMTEGDQDDERGDRAEAIEIIKNWSKEQSNTVLQAVRYAIEKIEEEN